MYSCRNSVRFKFSEFALACVLNDKNKIIIKKKITERKVLENFKIQFPNLLIQTITHSATKIITTVLVGLSLQLPLGA